MQIGQRLLSERVVSEEQLEQALQRQRLHGGRLGHNIVALGFISAEELEGFFKRHPGVPQSVEDTGLEPGFIAELVMKHALSLREFNVADLSDRIKLPAPVLDPALESLRKERFLEVKGAAGYMRETYTFMITEGGRNRASELLELNRYTGPAPVPLQDYKFMVEFQTIKNMVVTEEGVRKAFSHLVVGDWLLRRLGPAISSGRAVFLYGPPGNGKTAIAETIGKVLPGMIYMPYSMAAGGQVISVFDPVSHIPVRPETDAFDERWVAVRRPVILAGGELTLRMLELEFNMVTNFYEAPLQMKANNGLFIVDDFGRQIVEPRSLLNRWIVPLERRTDFMTLHTGMKFDIPFDQLVIFSTNIDPGKLVDEAFLRRIRYKIKIDYPGMKDYEAIFRRVCEANGITFNQKAYEHLLGIYKRLDVRPNACHPRDLIDHIIDSAHYYNHAAELNVEAIAEAWESYFVET